MHSTNIWHNLSRSVAQNCDFVCGLARGIWFGANFNRIFPFLCVAFQTRSWRRLILPLSFLIINFFSGVLMSWQQNIVENPAESIAMTFLRGLLGMINVAGIYMLMSHLFCVAREEKLSSEITRAIRQSSFKKQKHQVGARRIYRGNLYQFLYFFINSSTSFSRTEENYLMNRLQLFHRVENFQDIFKS